MLLQPAADLAEVHLIEAGFLIGPDGPDVRVRIRPARGGDHVFGHELGELPEVPWQREQLRGLAGDAVVGELLAGEQLGDVPLPGRVQATQGTRRPSGITAERWLLEGNRSP